MDRADVGIAERWFDHKLSAEIKLPGSLPERGIGDEVTVDTKWTDGIVDRSFYTAPQFAKYRQPGQVKVPFWLQPDKYMLASPGSSRLAGQASGTLPGKAALGNPRVGGWQIHRDKQLVGGGAQV